MGTKASKHISQQPTSDSNNNYKPNTVKSQQSSSHNYSASPNNIITFESDKNGKELLHNISGVNSSFPNVNNLKSLYCDIPSTLGYVTKDGAGYIVKKGNCETLSQKNILSFESEYGLNKILTKDKAKVKNGEVNLPFIDIDDQFVKIISSNHQTFYFLLTKNGKVFIYGDNPDCVLGISDATKKFNEFTLHPKLEHVKSKIVDIKCGYLFSVLRCENGDCYGTGYNCYINIGVVGRRTMNVNEFTLVEQLKGKVKQHSCGSFHTVYLTYNGEVYGCGLKTDGQFGKIYEDKLYNYTDCMPLTKLTFNNDSIHSFKSVLAGGYHSAFLTNNNTIFYCSNNKSSIPSGPIIKESYEYAVELNCGLDRYLGEFGRHECHVIEFGVLLFSDSVKGIVVCKDISNSKNVKYFIDNLGKAVYFGLLSDIDLNF